MATILLLHGAFRGGWAWGRVAARLTASGGHRVLSPDLLGAGERWHPDHREVGLEDTLDDLQAIVEVAGLQEIVLVGHSQGGFIAEALTQRIAPRLRVVCHLDAPVPVHGQRAIELQGDVGDGPAFAAPPRSAWVPPTPLDADVLGVPAMVARHWSSRLTPMSVALALDPVLLDAPAALAVPRRHAWCAGTPTSFPAWHTRRQRADEGDPVLDAPHDAPLARPDLVAEWVLRQV